MLPSSGCSQHGVICGECRETRYNKYLLISIMCTWNRAVFSLKIWRECRMNYKYYSLQMNNIWILIQNIIIMHLYLSFTSQLLFIQLAEVQSKGSVYFKDALKCCVPIFSCRISVAIKHLWNSVWNQLSKDSIFQRLISSNNHCFSRIFQGSYLDKKTVIWNLQPL